MRPAPLSRQSRRKKRIADARVPNSARSTEYRARAGARAPAGVLQREVCAEKVGADELLLHRNEDIDDALRIVEPSRQRRLGCRLQNRLMSVRGEVAVRC